MKSLYDNDKVFVESRIIEKIVIKNIKASLEYTPGPAICDSLVSVAGCIFSKNITSMTNATKHTKMNDPFEES